MTKPVDGRAAYYPGLDGLRALAVALVIGYHVDVPHLGGGLLGVGVFFTLSGYLITSILIGTWLKTGSLGLSTFWLRRARRLLPAVVLVLVAVLLAATVSRPSKLGEWGPQALAALCYVANWFTIAQGQSYFEKLDGPSPLEHLWSLSVEEQFYVIWPVAFLVLLRLLRGRLLRVAIVTFLLGLASMLLLSFVAQGGGDMTRAYEGTDTRAGGLLWGAALAMVWHPKVASRVGSARVRVAADAVGLLGLAGILALVTTTRDDSPFLYDGGIALLTVSTCAVLFAAAHNGTLLARALGITPLRWIGERTYGIYLWHMPVAAFLPARAFYGQTAVRAAIVVALTVALAALSWRFVEDPIRREGLLGALRRRSRLRVVSPFTLGATAVAALSVASLSAVHALPQTSVQEIARQAARAKPAHPQAAPRVARPAKGARLRTSCSSVVHIGDSSSLGPGDDEQTNVVDASKRLRGQYRSVGVTHVVEDVRGARSIVEHFRQDKNGLEAVQAQKRTGYSGCWVIALGMNDAATIDAGGTPVGADARIDLIMKEIGDDPVLWVTNITQAWASLPHYENANMATFNAALLEATRRHPSLRLYDWAAEAQPHPEWFLPDDANHTNGRGSQAKAKGVARALAVAFPSGKAAVASKVVASR